MLAAGGGLVVGLAATTLLAAIRKHITDPVLDTTLSFTAPFVAFLPAEAIGASGVVAVVVTGLLLGHKAPTLQSAASRLAEATNWSTVQFMLENAVFLLIGLQIRPILEAVGDSDLGGRAHRADLRRGSDRHHPGADRVHDGRGLGLPPRHGTDARARVELGHGGGRVVGRHAGRGDAGRRLPAARGDAPARGSAARGVRWSWPGPCSSRGRRLPWLVARLRLPAPSPAEDALQAAALISKASRAGLTRLEEVRAPGDPEEVIHQLRERAELRANGIWERLGRSQAEVEPPAATYRRLRLEMLGAERDVIVHARDAGYVDDVVLRAAMTAVRPRGVAARPRGGRGVHDRPRAAADPDPRRRLRAPARGPRAAPPRTPEGCEECLRDGLTWVHLRLCLTCGHVGCCDSSVGKHATGHFAECEHPVMRSIEPGEAWKWCYLDNRLG